MLKYVIAAATLKALSLTPLTRRVYRSLGNAIGGSTRASGNMPAHYIHRVNAILMLHRRYGVPRDGDRLLELGTGWVHWEALVTRLFFDIEAVLYDVWDNRQLDALKGFITQLEGALDTLDADTTQLDRARRLIPHIKAVGSFDALYRLLGFTYHVDHAGELNGLEAGTFDYAISTTVLEHVQRASAPALVQGIARALKPGGFSNQYIDIKDHLAYYDSTASPKQYLRYSDTTWRRFFENDVQYFNRIQIPDWRAMFEQAGLELIDEENRAVNLDGLPIATPYRDLSPEDLRCGDVRLLHRKPG